MWTFVEEIPCLRVSLVMASSVVDCGSCVACGSAFVGHHRAMCQTCDGNLCEWCFGAHARTPTPPALRGHVFEESSFERDRAALLIMFGLAAPAKVCGTHGKPLVFACASHGGSAPTVTGSTVESDSTISRVLLCTECISEHKGHDLISIDRHAKSVRALLGGVVAEQRPADLVRAVAVRTAVGIDMLPQLVASAHEQAVVARDALIAAVKERFDDVKAQIDAAASGSEAVLTAHLRANDVILDRATALAAGLRRATDYFDDIDIATYGGVLLAEVRKLNADATRIAATPETPPFIAFSVGTSLDDVALAVRRLGIVTRSPEEATAAEIVHASFPRLEEATAAARAEADKCRTRMSTAEAALEAARRESVAERAAEKRRLAENEMAIAKRIADADERAAAATARIVLLEVCVVFLFRADSFLLPVYNVVFAGATIRRKTRFCFRTGGVFGIIWSYCERRRGRLNNTAVAY